jgi:hypothetical protein
MNTRLKSSKIQFASHSMVRNSTIHFLKLCSYSLLVSVLGLVVGTGNLSAQAETMDSVEAEVPAAQINQTPVNQIPETNSTSVAADEMLVDSSADMTPESTAPVSADTESSDTDAVLVETTDEASLEPVGISTESQSQGFSTQTPAASTADTSSPETATPNTSSADLAPVDNTPGQLAQESATPDTSDVSPGRATRSGSSYIGVGGNIGLGEGDTALGDSSFAVFSKIGLTSNISVRPGVLIDDDPTILLPLTLDFTFGATDVTTDVSEDIGFRVNPFVGAGIAISTGDDSAVDLLVSGGVDIPITSRFTGTASLNATFFDNIAVGLLLGVGYNF